jgi:hypothetical protein
MARVAFEARADAPDGLPTGGPIGREAIAWFRRQQKKVLGIITPDMAELPDHFPPLADYDDPMSRAMTPIIAAYWQEAGARTTAGLAAKTGLDLDEWKVTNPHLRAMIEQSALKFCRSTNETTSKDLNTALADLRKSLIEGIVEKGEAPRQLAARVKEIFEGCETWKAHQIAVTEASRAVHAAQEEAAKQSGVVAGFEFLLSSDACPLCHAVSASCPTARLGQPFAIIGDNPDYSHIRFPPIHVNCQCAMTEILLPAYGGPEHPEWGETVHSGPKGAASQQEPEPGKTGPAPIPTPAENQARFPGHKIDPSDVAEFVKNSAIPEPLYHHGRDVAPLYRDGIDLAKTGGTYGQGLYASTNREIDYGPSYVDIALDVRNPRVGTMEEYERKLAKMSKAPTLDDVEVRKLFLKAGHDAVVIDFAKMHPDDPKLKGVKWVNIMKPETARFSGTGRDEGPR